MSRPGYLAAAPYASPGTRTPVFAALLDDDQLRCLDDTEPNYQRRLLRAAEHPLDLEARSWADTAERAARPAQFHLYASIHGVIGPPGAEPLPLGSQADVLRRLVAPGAPLHQLFAGMEPAHVVDKMARDGSLRDDVRARLGEAGWSRPAGIVAPSRVTHRYGQTPTARDGVLLALTLTPPAEARGAGTRRAPRRG